MSPETGEELELVGTPEGAKKIRDFVLNTRKRVIESMQEIVELEIHYAKKG